MGFFAPGSDRHGEDEDGICRPSTGQGQLGFASYETKVPDASHP